MQTRTRTRPTDTPCPHCDTPLLVSEIGFIPAEGSEPVAWNPQRRYCRNGCQYTADEVNQRG